MAAIPDQPKIYHITHVRNLARIVEEGVLWSDADRLERGLDCDVVGMSHIKARRLREIQVACHLGTFVGQYVPFYFCPRSVMLYLLHCGNHPDLNYTEGQGPIVHLEADLHTVVEWATASDRRWAFSDVNAGARYATFYADIAQLGEVNWDAVAARDFRTTEIKDGKQAEFLVESSFPWELVERLGVLNARVQHNAEEVIRDANHRPSVIVERSWYY